MAVMHAVTAHLDDVLHVLPIIVLAELQHDGHLAVVEVLQVHHRTRAAAAGGRLGRQVLPAQQQQQQCHNLVRVQHTSPFIAANIESQA
jgi:hypothetical protein